MFAIYRNGSVGFRSTADNLYEVKKTDSPDAVALKPDDDDLFQDFTASKKQHKDHEALNAYKKMANIDTTEPVYHVKDLMTHNPLTIESSKSLEQAYEKLKAVAINQIPILNSEKKIMGLINKKMILNMIMDEPNSMSLTLSKRLDELYLDEVITTDPISDIRRVAKVMIDFKLDAIPVVTEDDLLVGIVSKTDIIKAVSHLPKLQLWS